MKELFQKNGWSVHDLFAFGNPHINTREVMSEVAFGSLLHMVQDSFASGHVERALSNNEDMCLGTEHPAPGRIVEFHTYGKQDPDKHEKADGRLAFSKHWSSAEPDVIDIGKTLNDYFKRSAPWDEVKPYINCIFALAKETHASSAGDRFEIDCEEC